MPAKNHLTSEQQEKLQKALKREENGEIRERILILLLLNDGKTQQEIAKFIGCSKNKVCYWCVHGDPDDLESLKDERMKGNHQKPTEKYIEILLEILSESFYEVLKIFYQELVNEWIEARNNREDFADKGAKIVIILDNASFHKKQEYIQKIEAEMPNIHLEYLPKYSPDYNLIELVWHSAKEYIANRLFKSIEELEALLHQLLNEGGLVIKWGRKLKNKGNDVITV